MMELRPVRGNIDGDLATRLTEYLTVGKIDRLQRLGETLPTLRRERGEDLIHAEFFMKRSNERDPCP